MSGRVPGIAFPATVLVHGQVIELLDEGALIRWMLGCRHPHGLEVVQYDPAPAEGTGVIQSGRCMHCASVEMVWGPASLTSQRLGRKPRERPRAPSPPAALPPRAGPLERAVAELTEAIGEFVEMAKAQEPRRRPWWVRWLR